MVISNVFLDCRLSGALVSAFLWCAAPAAEPAPAPPTARPDGDCLECHADNTLTKTNALGQTVSLFVDNAVYGKSAHGTNTCMSCHADIAPEHPDNNVAAKKVDCALCHTYQSDTYQGSAHALALKSGEEGAATCTDCHGKHDIVSPETPGSRLHQDQLATTCGECHEEITEAVAKSIHGKSRAQGHREAATCIDCHSEHQIEDLRSSSPIKISQQICSKCHASEKINTKFRLPSDRVSTFMESYHGLASQYGSMRAANCSSCHGSHLILPSSDPLSSIHTNNIVATCGQCHPGATTLFATGKIHTDGEPGEEVGTQVNYWVRRIYLLLIFGTIGLMFAHNFITWGRRAMAAFRAPDRVVLRMDRPQRIQHFLLAASFIILAITGFALKFPDSWISHLLGSDENFRRISHRFAGVVMLGLGVYHVFYVILAAEGRRLLRDMMPTAKDLHDVGTNVRHLLLRGRPRPKFGRFGYPEKLEYWAVAWGTVIMGVTGLMIWFKIDVTQFLPRWAIDVATTIHYYEAILACLAILVWHFYFVFIDPEVYPINWAWWDGRVSKEWHHHEHPLDQARVVERNPRAEPPKSIDPNA